MSRAALLVVALALLPGLSLVAAPDAFLADPLSELPVKLWCFERFPEIGLFGGRVEAIGFPNTGPLNNPDIVGTLVTGALRPLLGRVWAYDVLVLAQLVASALAAWALARDLVEDAFAAAVAAVAFALAPVVLVYCVAGAVTDMLNLWPYPLCARHLLRAARQGSPKDGALAGLFAGLGFVTCPYNVLVFAAALVPAAPFAPWRRWRALLPAAIACVVTGGVIAGLYALRVRAIMDDPTSQMSTALVGATRHAPPYPFLEPAHPSRYVAWLADYVAVGKDALIVRDAGSRYYRAFSPGLLVGALAVLGAVRRPAARPWLAVAIFAALASTGPFLAVTGDVALPVAGNPAWLLLHHAVPGASLLLEPFRYAIAAGLGLGVAAAFGAATLPRLAALAPVLVVAELAIASPVPVPLPTARLAVPEAYWRLAGEPGAIVELPWFDRGTERFARVHFLHQLVHGRPIADEVLGFPPRYLRENQFTAGLLQAEKGDGVLRVEVTAPERVDADRARLAADGFSAIVVDPEAYATHDARDRVRAALTAAFGEPVRGGGREVWAVR